MARPHCQGKDGPGEAVVNTRSKFPFTFPLLYCWYTAESMESLLFFPKVRGIFLIPNCYSLTYSCYFDKYPFVFPFEHSYLLTLAILWQWVPLPNFPCRGRNENISERGWEYVLYYSHYTLPRTHVQDLLTLKSSSMMKYWPDAGKKADTSGNRSNVSPQLSATAQATGPEQGSGSLGWCWARLSFSRSWGTALPFALKEHLPSYYTA